MFNIMQKALIKKEVRTVVRSRGFFIEYMLVPLIMALILPVGVVIGVAAFNIDLSDFDELFAMMAIVLPNEDVELAIISLLMNTMMPMFFLMIPPMIVTAMAAGSFTGEKERRTLETLLYTPMSLKEIFSAKVAASLYVAMFVTVISFSMMLTAVMGLTWLLLGNMYVPDVLWAIIIGFIAPAFAFLAIIIQVRISAKAKSSEEAYQRGGVIVLPLILLLVGQMSGFMFIGFFGFLIIGALLVAISLLLMRGTFKKISYESLLK